MKGKLIRSQRLPSSAGQYGLTLAIGDVTGDGLPDAVIGSVYSNPKIRVYILAGTTWKLQQTIFAFTATNGQVMRIAVGDVTGDGQADIVVAGLSGTKATVKVFSKGLRVSQFSLKSSSGVRPELVDVNNSGVKDILLVPSKGATVAVYTISGKRLASYTLPTTVAANIRLTSGDTDNNGRAELIVSSPANSGSVRIYNNKGKLKKTLSAFSQSESGVVTAIGDINGDGNTDLVAASGNGSSGSVKVWRISTMKPLWTGVSNPTVIREISLALGNQ